MARHDELWGGGGVTGTSRSAKKARRAERKAAEAAARRRSAQMRKLKLATAGLVIVGLVVVSFVLAAPDELDGVEIRPELGRDHVALGEAVDYDSATPTSGTHATGAPRCGILVEPLPLELAVHALEHGAVVIWYRPDLSPAVVEDIAGIVESFDDAVILSPNPGLVDEVVATAWNRLKTYAGADAELADFIDVYRYRGPERVGCPY